MVYTIAIVEDDLSVAMQLEQLCIATGYNALRCRDFQHVVQWVEKNHCDLVLLDIHIPYLSGQTILPMIKSTLDLPVIMITSSMDEIDEVMSMSHGADDYITKPFNPTILMLRIANILKRYHPIDPSLIYHGLVYDPKTMMLSCNGQTMPLTRNEALIISILIQQGGTIVSRNTLMDALWENESYINDNALNVNISRLRDKLDHLHPELTIQTKKGSGYMLCDK